MMSTQSGDTIAKPSVTELQPLVTNWWMMAGRGVLAVLFGAAISLWRAPVFDAVTMSFGAYAIVFGVVVFLAALQFRRAEL